MSSHQHQTHPTVAAPPDACVVPPSASGDRQGRVDRLLADPRVQREVRGVVGRVQGVLAGRAVVEPVCGDGWWTAHLAQAAQAVTALTDDPAALRRAAARRLPPNRVRLVQAAPEDLPRLGGAFDGGFGAFLCAGPSAFCRTDVLTLLHRRLGPGAAVVLVDAREPEAGSAAMAEDDLRARVRETAPDARALKVDVGERLWCLSYTL
ncbi:methyltransferase domain-containing protein [Caenispirillum salinarum]|uniref:methyltransferase domain-containing protein n=1 Tax=Caenispirillum salinarum TaxID=859058 RepID=UPI00384EA023